jgi:hypothetical protein
VHRFIYHSVCRIADVSEWDFVCPERLSNLVALVPVANLLTFISALEVARALVDNLVCWFLVPFCAFSGRGPGPGAHFRAAVLHHQAPGVLDTDICGLSWTTNKPHKCRPIFFVRRINLHFCVRGSFDELIQFSQS